MANATIIARTAHTDTTGRPIIVKCSANIEPATITAEELAAGRDDQHGAPIRVVADEDTRTAAAALWDLGIADLDLHSVRAGRARISLPDGTYITLAVTRLTELADAWYSTEAEAIEALREVGKPGLRTVKRDLFAEAVAMRVALMERLTAPRLHVVEGGK